MGWANMIPSPSSSSLSSVTMNTTLDSYMTSDNELVMNQKNSSSNSTPTTAPTHSSTTPSSPQPSPSKASSSSSSSSSSPSSTSSSPKKEVLGVPPPSSFSFSSSSSSSSFSRFSSKWNRHLPVRIFMILTFFPFMKIAICLMHAPVLMETLGMHETLKHSHYLLTHVPFTPTYVFFYDAHQWTSAFWFISGVWQYILYYYRRDLVAHKYLGYMYVIAAMLSPVCGVIMLLYRPKLIGGNNFTVYLLLFTTWYCMNGIYKMLVAIIVNKNLREHQRWALRNIFGPISSISNASTITTLAYMGMPINAYTTRMVMCCLSPFLFALIESICAYMHPNHEFMTDWAYMITPIRNRIQRYAKQKHQ